MKGNLDNLLTVCKRAAMSKFEMFIIHNRMMIGCYDITQDDDNGMHVIIHIPDDYEDFYDGHFVWPNKFFIAKCNETKKKVDEERAKRNLPPRAVTREFDYHVEKDKMVVEAYYILHEMIAPPPETKRKTLILGDPIMNLGFTMECDLFTNDYLPHTAEVVLDVFNKLQERMTGDTILIDGLENDVISKVLASPRVFYCKVPYDDECIQVPLLKSFFRGINKFDRMMFGVTKTSIDGVAVLTMTFDSKGLTEQYVAYVQNFKE